MKIFLLLTVFLFSLMTHAKSVQCIDSENSRFKVIVIFDSVTPLLAASFITYKPDGSVERESSIDYLTTEAACGTKLDFLADCAAEEKQGALGYSFQFNCKSKKLSGEFYVDENGTGNFSCNNSTGSSVFFGCVVR